MVNLILKQYKNGSELNFPALFNIPTDERLPALVQKDFLNATALVVATLTFAFEKLGSRKKNDDLANLIFNIADEVIDTAEADNISLEDLMLFLQGLVRGEYGESTELTVAKFMSKFNQYRDDRWSAALQRRDEKEEYYKRLGDDNWHERNNRVSSIDEEFATLRKKFEDKKDEKALQKKEAELSKK